VNPESRTNIQGQIRFIIFEEMIYAEENIERKSAGKTR
jgi:hypothetical protein